NPNDVPPQERGRALPRNRRRDDHRDLRTDRPLVVLQLLQPRGVPTLGLLGLPDDRSAVVCRWRAHALEQVRTGDALGNRLDRVEWKSFVQHGLESQLQRFPLPLLRALLQLALEVGGFLLRLLDLGVLLRQPALELLAHGRALLRCDALSLVLALPLGV